MASEDLLSLEETAQVLNVPPGMVNSWMKQGVLTPVLSGAAPAFRFEEVQIVARRHLKSLWHDRRVLILDDDPLVGSSLKLLLDKSGFQAVTIPVGLAALDLAAKETFDLIIADIRMPGMNGLQTLKAIRDLRNQFGKPAIPEIVITAYDDEAVRREVNRMGITDFILKPFEAGELIEKLKHRFSEGLVS